MLKLNKNHSATTDFQPINNLVYLPQNKNGSILNDLNQMRCLFYWVCNFLIVHFFACPKTEPKNQQENKHPSFAAQSLPSRGEYNLSSCPDSYRDFRFFIHLCSLLRCS